MYYSLKTMTRIFRKYEQVENITVHLQNTLTYYDKIKVLIGLIHEEGVARVIATEERNVNMSKSVTLLCTFKHRKRNYMKDKIYLKQRLLKDSFDVKRYGKGLLVQIEEEEMYKIFIDRAFTEDENSPFKK